MAFVRTRAKFSITSYLNFLVANSYLNICIQDPVKYDDSLALSCISNIEYIVQDLVKQLQQTDA